MAESIKFQIDLPVSPERVYRAWLDSAEHSRFTHSPARIEAKVGGRYSVYDGLVQGETQVMTPFTRIVQTWRMRTFPPEQPDTLIKLKLEPTCLGALLILEQTGIPDGQAKDYLDGWITNYARPLQAYFDELVGDSAADIDG